MEACFGAGGSFDDLDGEQSGDENEELTTTYGGTAFPIVHFNTQDSDSSSWNFFIDPGNWWQVMEILPPLVLVPFSQTLVDV